MSKQANYCDNAQAEGLFSKYKAELLEGSMFEDVSQARGETFSYIEGHNIRMRHRSASDHKSPDEFE